MAAIKGPGGRAPDVGRIGAGKGPPLGPVESALLASGVAKTPVEARVLARSLLAALKAAGFPAPPGGGASDQLRAFQRAHGLPETGKLDDATRTKLVELGILPRGAASGEGAKGPGQAKGKGAPEAVFTPPRPGAAPALGPKGYGDLVPGARPPGPPAAAPPAGERVHVVEHEQAKARAEHMKDHASPDLSRFLEGLASLGFLGGGKGKQRLERALASFQKANQLLVTGKLDAATVRTLIAKGALPADTQVPPERSAPRPESAASASTRAQASDDPASARASTRSSASSSSSSSSTSSSPTSIAHPAPSPAASGNTTDLEVDEHPSPDDRNAAAGDDEVDDERRGHATLDDDTEDPEGHYEVPSLALQIREALEAITRDDDQSGATTYSWDVTFYKPGIYGRRQPAEPLWHVVVERAGAFDPVWQEARRVLSERMSVVEPDGRPPSDDDFMLALRRARVRAPSPS